MLESSNQVMLNSDYIAWKRTDCLIKGWIVSTLIEDILSQIIGMEFVVGIWCALKRKLLVSTVDMKLALHNQLQTLCRDNCYAPGKLLESTQNSM